MDNSKYSFPGHVGTALVAGLFFSLLVGTVVGLKMVGINEATHQFRLAYPFLLNFIPMYLLVGVVLGAAAGILGSLLLRDELSHRSLGFPLALGMAGLAFLVMFLIFHAPLGPVLGIFLGLLILSSATGIRPPLSRIYFSVFLTATLFNYSWQWVRMHFIVNPFVPIPRGRMLDVIFTLAWALFFLLGYRLFLKSLYQIRVKGLYLAGAAIIGGLLVVGGGAYLLQPQPVAVRASRPPDITRRPVDTKVVLVGVDGMWWQVMEDLMAKGELPAIQKMILQGSSGRLKTLLPTFSATIWTTISTGKDPAKHGLTSFLLWKFPWTGFTVPCFQTPKITAELDWMRQNLVVVAPMNNQFLDVAPVWDMLSDHNVTVGMVDWWLSYPAYPIKGFNITNHCLYNKASVMENFKSREGNSPYDIYPPELLKEVQSFSKSPDDLTEDEIRRFINIADSDRAFLEDFQAIHTYDYLDIAYEASMFKYSYPEDATFAAATRYLLANRQPDFLCVYLDGMDSMEHQYLKYYFADQHPDKLLPQNLARYGHLIENYYLYIDSLITAFKEAADPNTIFMVISDHGFDMQMLPTGHYNHMNAPPGVFLCSGPGIKAGFRVDNARVQDITPTVLYMLGMPMGADFDGQPLTPIMSDPVPVETIPTYDFDRSTTHQVLRSDMDEGYKEKLKALGYTQ